MERRTFIKLSGAALASSKTVSGYTETTWQQKSRPNILMITCHDISRHFGCYGVPSLSTPNLDKLAGRGIRFNRFYSTSGVCSPGRDL